MSTQRRLVACAACGTPHPGHFAGASGPHYCSIGCYRNGHGLDDAVTGDGRHWCGGCQRYFSPTGNQRFCSDACRVADWRRRQPQRSPSPPQPRRAATIDTTGLSEAMSERAPARYVDDASANAVDTAVDTLAMRRRLQPVGDAGATLHVLASLAAQVEELLPAAVVEAQDHGYTWTEIAALLGASRDRAQHLAARYNPTGRAPLTD